MKVDSEKLIFIGYVHFHVGTYLILKKMVDNLQYSTYIKKYQSCTFKYFIFIYLVASELKENMFYCKKAVVRLKYAFLNS